MCIRQVSHKVANSVITFLLVVSYLFYCYGFQEDVTLLKPRVLGSAFAEDGQLPFMVHVIVSMPTGNSKCSASLISLSFVLLAAHCFPKDKATNAADVRAIAGIADIGDYIEKRYGLNNWDIDIPDEELNGGQERRGSQISIDQNYKDIEKLNDLAILTVKEKFLFTKNVQPIEMSFEKLPDGTLCTIAGWGYKDNKSKTSTLLGYATRVKAYQTGGDSCSGQSSGAFYCVKKPRTAICHGDSGSPLYCHEKVWGVASHIMTTSSCGVDTDGGYYAALYDSEMLTMVHDLIKEDKITKYWFLSFGASVVFVVVIYILIIFLLQKKWFNRINRNLANSGNDV